MKTTTLLVIVVAIFTIIFHIAASAGGRERDNGDTVNVYNTYIKDDRYGEGLLKGAGAVVLSMCGIWPATKSYIWPATVAVFTLSNPKFRKWENCWEGDKPDPMPKPGPVLNDVTPDKPVGVKLYQ